MAIQLKSEIALVNDVRDLLLAQDTRITQNATAISLLANQTQIDEITGELSTLQAELLVQANEISTKVSQTDYTGNTIASLINQSATTVQIQASRINLTGYVTVTNLSTAGQTTINGSNITTGALNANLITTGKITAVNIEGVSIIGTTITGGTINGTTITTSADMNVGKRIKMAEIPVSDITDLVAENNGRNGISWGASNPPSTYPRAFVTAYNATSLSGFNDWRVVIKADTYIVLNAQNIQMFVGGALRTITRDSNGFLRAN